MEKLLQVTPEKCTGCRNCELACSYAHMVDGLLGASRIHVYTIKPMERGIPVVCMQCYHAACMKACPAWAIRRNRETGALEVDYGRCIGCKACVAACPFGNMTIEPLLDSVIKCDLCGGSPKCVEFCPTGALTYEVVDYSNTTRLEEHV